MSITTIKLHETTKTELDYFREEKDSYDEVIQKLISKAREKSIKGELTEGYKSLGKDDIEILKEWEGTSEEW